MGRVALKVDTNAVSVVKGVCLAVSAYEGHQAGVVVQYGPI